MLLRLWRLCARPPIHPPHLLGRILLASFICSIQLLLRRAINAPHLYFYYTVSQEFFLPLYSLLLMPYHILECAVGDRRAGHRARHVKFTTRARVRGVLILPPEKQRDGDKHKFGQVARQLAFPERSRSCKHKSSLWHRKYPPLMLIQAFGSVKHILDSICGNDSIAPSVSRHPVRAFPSSP